jgi:hypothetical protein
MTQIGRIKFHKREVSIIYFYSLIPETGIKGGVNDESTLNTNTQVVSLAGKIMSSPVFIWKTKKQTTQSNEQKCCIHA